MTANEQDRIRALVRQAGDTEGDTAGPIVERLLLGEVAQRRAARRRRILAAPIAVAAAAVTLIAFGALRKRETVIATVPEIISPAPIVRAEPPKLLTPAVRVRPRPVTSRKPAVQRAQAEPVTERVDSEFIPVGPWQAVIPMERGSIVRVRLPRGSLQSFGVPVIAERWNESVPADLMLGEDGSVRAFRLVSARNSYQ